MIELKKVRGSQTAVPQLEVNIDTVYVRSNIMSIDEHNFKGWEYDEIQYKKDEYIELMSKKAESESADTSEMIIDIDFRLSNIELGL
jgi:hypothetical protein